MNPCNDIVVEIYQNEKINNLISKVKPTELQDDLRQELALILLSYDCQKLMRLQNEGNINAFVLRIIINMGMSTNSPFYYKYKKNDIGKAVEYFKLMNVKDWIDTADIAKNHLEVKLSKNANEAHESIIFSKYVEMRNCQKVAEYFGLPHKHVFDVVKKTKNQLKKIIKNQNI